MTHKAPKLDIDELAAKHLNRHINDKSNRYLAQMRRSFRPIEVTQALKKAIRTHGMIYPDMLKLLQEIENGNRLGNIDKIIAQDPFYQEPNPKTLSSGRKIKQLSYNGLTAKSPTPPRIILDDLDF